MTLTPRTVALGEHQLNRIGLGTNRLTDTAQNRSFLETAIGAGLNFVDTAHLYAGGESEATIGNVLSDFPGDVVVATKGGYHPGGGTKQLREELETSFARLQTGRIALYYLHRVDPEVPLEESMAVLKEYRDAGRIEHVGLSDVSVEQIQRAESVLPIAAVQNEYNLSERGSEPVIDYCTREGILFVPFYPLGGKESPLLLETADRYEAMTHQISLAWLLHRSPIVLPIPGTLSSRHLSENLAAIEIELSAADAEALTADA